MDWTLALAEEHFGVGDQQKCSESDRRNKPAKHYMVSGDGNIFGNICSSRSRSSEFNTCKQATYLCFDSEEKSCPRVL
jgi:hypothetical protein